MLGGAGTTWDRKGEGRYLELGEVLCQEVEHLWRDGGVVGGEVRGRILGAPQSAVLPRACMHACVCACACVRACVCVRAWVPARTHLALDRREEAVARRCRG